MNSSKVKSFKIHKTSFQDDWLSNSDFRSWIKRVDGDINSAKCSVCCKTFSISGQVIKQLQSHSENAKHQERLPKDQTQLTFSVKQSTEQQPQPSSSKELKQYTIISTSTKLQATHAEIIWAVDVVLSNYSFNSSSSKSDLFCAVFPGSSIVKTSMWKDKM